MSIRLRTCYLTLAWIAGTCLVATAEPEPQENGQTEARQPEAAQEPEARRPETKFVRLVRNSREQPQSLDTAIVEFVAEDAERAGLKVALIGAVHIGEKSYYQKLNEEFEKYDALLYELVAPDGTTVPRGGGENRSAVSGLQTAMKDVLELEFQLEHVDYQKPNFVHADMSPDDFARSMSDRGESIWTMFFRLMGQSILQQSRGAKGASDASLLLALFDPHRAVAMKRLMAEQFEDLEGSMAAFEGPEGSTIITERNKVALKVLGEQIAAGKKKIGIFYGAGHLPDMEQRLLNDFKLKPGGQRWLTAWNLKAKAKPKSKKRSKAHPSGNEQTVQPASP